MRDYRSLAQNLQIQARHIADASDGTAKAENTMYGEAATAAEVAADALDALELIQGFNWSLDDTSHGKEIKRRALAAIAKGRER